MPNIAMEAAGLVLDFVRGKTSLQKIADKFNVDSILKVLSDKAGTINFEDVRNSFLQMMSNATSPTWTIPCANEIPGISGVYLSKTKVEELKENLNTNKALLAKIPDGIMAEYRRESLQLIDRFIDELEEYEKCFDVLTEGKFFRFFHRSKSIDYDKIWAARKAMKKNLSNMEKLLDDYNRTGKADEGRFKFTKFGEWLEEVNKAVKERTTDELAKTLYVNAYESIYSQLVSVDVGSSTTKMKTVKDLFNEYKDKDIQKAALERDLSLLDGANTTYQEPSAPNFDPQSAGGKRCRALAERQFRDKNGSDPFTFCGFKAGPPFMGDYVVKIMACIKKTKNDIDNAVNLGAKKAKIDQANGSLGVNLSTLLGNNYKHYVKNLEKQTDILGTAVTKDLVKRLGPLHSKVEKEYKKISQYMSKHFPGPNPKDAPVQGEKYYDFSQFKVNLISSSSGADKEYNIAARHTELEKDYTAALDDSKKQSTDCVSLYIREAERFLKACEAWGKMRRGYEKLLDDRKVKAKDWLKKVKKHYQELKSTDNLDGSVLEKIKQKYGEFPMFAYKFVKNYRVNIEKAREFCGYKVISNGSKLVKSDNATVT